jgi:hypothetical protein
VASSAKPISPAGMPQPKCARTASMATHSALSRPTCNTPRSSGQPLCSRLRKICGRRTGMADIFDMAQS